MGTNSQLMLTLGDGTPIWFALHEHVTNLPLLAQLIQKHQGSVVNSIVEADFCLLSACRPDAKDAAARVVEEGGVAVDASWIWESNAVGRLLPWYPYQLGNANRYPDMSDEMRDTHELSISLARYLPIVGSVDHIYTHLAQKLPHRKAIQFKELHEQRKQAVDACVLHLANQMDNVTPPVGYFNNVEMEKSRNQSERSTQPEPAHPLPPPSGLRAPSTSLSVNRTSFSFSPAIPKAVHTRVMNGIERHQQKSATSRSGTAAQPPSNGGVAEVNGVDLVPVQFPIEEQDDDVNTRMSTGSILPRLTAIPEQTQISNPTPLSAQHDSGKDKQNHGPSGSSVVQTEGPTQPPNELPVSPQNGRIPANPFAMKVKAGPPHRVTDAGAGNDPVSESHLEGFQHNKPVPNLRDAMDQDETDDEDKESGDGDYRPRTARIRLRDEDDSDEEERPKRRKKNRVKDKGTEKVRDRGEMRSRKPPVAQHQIDAMIQWGLNHPMEQGANQKAYWSKFVEESDIGKERTWASWEALSRYHGKPPILNRREPAQGSTSITVDPTPQASRKLTSTLSITIPPKPKAAGIRDPAPHQVKSAQSNPPPPGMGVSASPSPAALPKNSSQTTIMRGSTDVNTTTTTSYKPPGDPLQIRKSVPEGNTVDKDNIQNLYRIPAVTGAWPYSALQHQNGPQQNDNAPTKVSGGFTHSVRAPALFKDKYPFASRPAFQEQRPTRLPDDLVPPRVGHD